MKLYAIVTSERASKEQGGNKYLHIKILNKDKSQFCWINVEKDNIAVFSNDEEVLDIVNHGTMAVIKTKAKKRKVKCTHDWDNYGKCCICGKWDIKGERIS